MDDLSSPVSQDFVYNSTVRGTEDFKDLETPLTPMVSYSLVLNVYHVFHLRRIVSYGSVLSICPTVRAAIKSRKHL